MATLEATPSPEKKPSPVPTRGGLYDWELTSISDVELEVEDMPSDPGETEPKEAERHQLQDPQKSETPVESKEEPLARQGSPGHFKQSSTPPRGDETPLSSAGSSISPSKDTGERQHSRKFWRFSVPKFLKRSHSEQQPVGFSPTQPSSAKPKSLSPSPLSQKSPSSMMSPRDVPGQKKPADIFVRSAGTPKVSEEVQTAPPPPLIKLVNITDQDFVPREVSKRFI